VPFLQVGLLPNMDLAQMIEALGINIDICTVSGPTACDVIGFKSQLKATDEVIACLEEDIQNLLHETK
jgi:hypothetical protein